MNNQAEEFPVDPYSKLAYVYDELMSYVDYKSWARFIVKIIQKWHSAARTILDVSCGTGSLLLKLDLKKYRLLGCDCSGDMLKIARRKCKASKTLISLWQGNMISFQLKQKVDVIISLYDSVNYILHTAGWKKMLACAYDGLDSNGLFIFDICTEKNSREFFHNYYERRSGKDFYYTRESRYNSESKIHSNLFKIHFDAVDKTFVEFHEQKIVRINEVLDLIKQTDFQLLGFYHGFTFRAGDENSLRVHFVLKKEIIR